MRIKFFKLLSMALCFSIVVPILAYAAPVKEQIVADDTDSYDYDVEVLEEMAFPEYVLDEDTYEITDIDVSNSEDTEPRIFMNYFPDQNFAQGVAEALGKNKTDFVTEQELSSLRSIFLQNKNIVSIEGIHYLNNLIFLNVSVNKIQTIPPEIGKLTKLFEFVIFSNQITSIPREIGNLYSLYNFNIGGNLIDTLPIELFNLINLKGLDVSSNLITEIPREIENLNKLSLLDLSSNRLTYISSELCNLVNLNYLSLNCNLITALPENIGDLTNLKDLRVGSNRLETLPDSIWSLPNLTYLSLGGNGNVYLGHVYNRGNKLSYISPKIKNLINLESLDITYNMLTEVPEEIGELTKLSHLNLGMNKITSLPQSLTNLTNLQTLYMPDNKLTEEIPLQFLNLNSLTLNPQKGELPLLTIQNTSNLTYNDLLSPLILQAKSLYDNQLIGIWTIITPGGNTIKMDGGDGSEITSDLFITPGAYHVSFIWDGIDTPNVWRHVSSTITIEVEKEANQLHNVTLITKYLDNALLESTTTYQVEHGSPFLESFEILDGYELYNSMLRNQPVFHVDMYGKTVGLNVVDRDYTIILEFDKAEYKVKLNTSYLDGYLPDTTKTDWTRYGEGYFQTYEIAEGYQVANLEELPTDIFIDETNHTAAINCVTQGCDINLKFEKKQYDVTIRVVYEDDSRDEQISTYAVPYGDRFETDFDIEKGYSIKKVSFNAVGVLVNRSRQEVTVEKVTSPVEIVIIVR